MIFPENLNPFRIARQIREEAELRVRLGEVESLDALRSVADRISGLCAADNPAHPWAMFMKLCGLGNLIEDDAQDL